MLSWPVILSMITAVVIWFVVQFPLAVAVGRAFAGASGFSDGVD